MNIHRERMESICRCAVYQGFCWSVSLTTSTRVYSTGEWCPGIISVFTHTCDFSAMLVCDEVVDHEYV